MNAAQIAQRTLLMIDQTISNRFSYEMLATMLAGAYEEFKEMCPPECFEIPYAPAALGNVYDLDLTGILSYSTVGASPSEKLAARLTRVIFADAQGNYTGSLTPATSWETLRRISTALPMMSGYYGQRWWYDGTILRFSAPMTGQIQIWYLPMETIDWVASIQPGVVKFVDNIVQFHDVIVMLAAKQYYIQQSQPNVALEREFARREDRMLEFFAKSRSGNAAQYVQDSLR